MSIIEQFELVCIQASDEYGIPRIFKALDRTSMPIVYIKLDEKVQDDEIAQGNRLADALKMTLGTPLFGYGMPLKYGIAILEQYIDLLGPFVFVLDQFQFGIPLMDAIKGFAKRNSQIIARSVDVSLINDSEDWHVVTVTDLLMTLEEAQAYSKNRLSENRLASLWEKSGQAYEIFVQMFNSELGLTKLDYPHLPKAQRPLDYFNPKIALDILVKQEKWIDAFELAVEHFPSLVPKLIGVAGHHFQSKGLHKALKQSIDQLPVDVRKNEQVLRFTLSAAFRTGIDKCIIDDIEEVLEESSAYELRAMYAGIPNRAYSERLQEASLAFEALPSPVTSYYYGTLLSFSDPYKSIDILRASVSLAESVGYDYEIARNASALASSLGLVGKYNEAWSWTTWAIKVFNRQEIGDASRLIKILNEWSYNCILLGKLTGVENKLQDVISVIHLYPKNISELLRSTIGDLYFVTHRYNDALEI